MPERRTVPSATGDGIIAASLHPTVDESRTISTAVEDPKSRNDFYGHGSLWALMSLALCFAIGFLIAYCSTGKLVFELIANTILQVSSLVVCFVPAVFLKGNVHIDGRITFVLLCLVSLVSVVIAWALWFAHIPNWPQALLSISNVFLTMAVVQLLVSRGNKGSPPRSDAIGMQVLAPSPVRDSEAQRSD